MASTATQDPKVDTKAEGTADTKSEDKTEAKTVKGPRPYVNTPFQVCKQLNAALKAAGLDGNVQGPMCYQYAKAGRMGEITQSDDGREQVDPEKAKEFIEKFVAGRLGKSEDAETSAEDSETDAETDAEVGDESDAADEDNEVEAE